MFVVSFRLAVAMMIFSFFTFYFCSETGLGKALDAAQEKECEDLKLWRPAVINHLYWTAASTLNGDPAVMEG